MPFGRFQLFNVAGALAWVGGLVAAGYFFGNIPFIKDHLNTIVLLGLAAAIVPVVGAGLFADSFAPPISQREEQGHAPSAHGPVLFRDVGMDARSAHIAQPCERRIRGEVTLDPRHHGSRQLSWARRCAAALFPADC